MCKIYLDIYFLNGDFKDVYNYKCFMKFIIWGVECFWFIDRFFKNVGRKRFGEIVLFKICYIEVFFFVLKLVISISKVSYLLLC